MTNPRGRGEAEDLDLTGPIELVALSVKDRARRVAGSSGASASSRCGRPGSGYAILMRLCEADLRCLGLIDNRPYLRCMKGVGLCLWRLGRFEEAERVFARMLWLNPPDNQGVRFLVGDVRAGRRWEDRQEPR